NDAFSDLTSSGIAGFIPRSLGATCADVLTYVTANGPYTKSAIIKDPFKDETITGNMTLKAIAEVIVPYFCDPLDPGGAACSGEKYNLQMDFSINSGDGWDQKGRIKLACDNSAGNAGSYERYEIKVGESYRQLLLWQTTDQN